MGTLFQKLVRTSANARLDRLQHVIGPWNSNRLGMREPRLHKFVNLVEDRGTFTANDCQNWLMNATCIIATTALRPSP
jgi:hypothetical protein